MYLISQNTFLTKLERTQGIYLASSDRLIILFLKSNEVFLVMKLLKFTLCPEQI